MMSMMTEKSKKIFQTILAAVCAVCLCLGVLFLGGFVTPVKAEDSQTAEVTGVQVRSAGSGTENFIVLQSPVYEAGISGTITAANYNTLSKIKVYTSPEDADGKLLSDGLIGGWWEYSYWGTNALFLAYNNPADYETYNGTTIYKITIEAGCELPCGDMVYTTSETVTYINQDFGSESAKNMASNWQKEIPVLDGEISGVQVRSAGSGTENFIVLQSSFYEAGVSGAIVTANYNTLSKIKVYLSAQDKEGKTLSEGLIGGWWEYSYWGTNALFLAYNNPADYEIYNGATIYKIVIEEGCELPCDDVKYVTTETKTFYNLDHGNDAVVNDARNWKTSSLIESASAASEESAGIFHIESDSVSQMNYAGVYTVEDSVAYYFHNAAYSGNAEVRFVTEGTDSVGAESVYEVYKAYKFSFDYKIVNTNIEPTYSVQIVGSDGSLGVVEFDAVADGAWHTFTYKMSFSQTEKFAGFSIKISRLEGEMLIANISAEQDTTPPAITVTQVSQQCNEGTEFVYEVTATDAVDGEVAVMLVAPEGMFDENDKLLPGTWKISFTASDAMGNKATSAEYTVIVKDITPPVITLGGTTAYEAGVAYSEDLPDGMTLTITDNVDKEITEYLVTLEEGAVADGKLQIGVWTVTVKASDAAGNEGIATAEITVTDTQKPVITLDNEKTVTQYDEGDEPVIVATAQDSYDGEVNVSVVYPEGALQDERLVAGTWTITLTAKDTSSNAAEPVTVNITVADKTPPEIMIGGRTEYGAGTAYTEGLPAGMSVAITDNVDGEVTDYTVELESGAVADGKLVAGEWTVTITAKDKAGNESSKTIDITVTADSTPPDITLGGITTYEAGTVYTENSILDLTVAIIDNVDGEITEYTVELQSGTVVDGKLQVGTWMVTVRASDAAGNEGTTMAEITVTDTQKPIIMIDSEKTVTEYNEGDELNIVASASDSYDGDIDVELDIPEGAIKDGKLVAGEWTVTITASDKAGNEATPVKVIIEVNETSTGTGCSSAINGIAGIAGAIAAVVICAVVLVTVFKRKKKA